MMTYYDRHREERLAYQKAYDAEHPRNRKDYQKSYQIKHPGYHIASRYGLTQDEYQSLKDKQKGKCACCGEKSDRLFIDHDHKTGKVRGLICHYCNTAIGFLKDSPERCLRAAKYLKRHRARELGDIT